MQIIGVIGAGQCDEDVATRAYAVGKRIAEAGHALVCGGLGGVMAAACHGAVEAGGLTIGVLPGDSANAANSHVKLPIVTGMGVARNVIIVRSAAAIIAVSGGPGTLSEMAYALQFDVPVVSLGSWDVSPAIPQVDSADDAIAWVLSHL